MSEIFQSFPAGEGVREVGRDEGEPFDVEGAHLVWKVKAADSVYSFSVNEMTLAPGEGVPLHGHTSAECFYVLTGDADFFRLQDGQEDWVRAEAGETIVVPPNSLHGFFNRGASICRVLGISTAVHQTFFDAVARLDRETSFASMDPFEAMGRLARSRWRTICTSHPWISTPTAVAWSNKTICLLSASRRHEPYWRLLSSSEPATVPAILNHSPLDRCSASIPISQRRG
jgi:quercetin dioxygenase-like cupin family protein